MSSTLSILCDRCKHVLWIGQADYIYSAQKNVAQLHTFLLAHQGHELRVVNEQHEPDYDEEPGWMVVKEDGLLVPVGED